MLDRRLPKPTVLRNRTILITPGSALRTDISAPPSADEEELQARVRLWQAGKCRTVNAPSTPVAHAPTPEVALASIPATTARRSATHHKRPDETEGTRGRGAAKGTGRHQTSAGQHLDPRRPATLK